MSLLQLAGGERPAALLAPVLMSVWSMALLVSGEIIDADRQLGTLEPLVAAPASFHTPSLFAACTLNV